MKEEVKVKWKRKRVRRRQVNYIEAAKTAEMKRKKRGGEIVSRKMYF